MAHSRFRALVGLAAIVVALPSFGERAPIAPRLGKAPDLIATIHMPDIFFSKFGEILGMGFKMGLCNTLHVDVQNRSHLDIDRTFSVRVFYAKKIGNSYKDTGDFRQQLTVAGLDAGQRKHLYFTDWKLTKTLKGLDYYIVAQVDSAQQVIEQNETNNEKGLFLPADLLDWELPCERKTRDVSLKDIKKPS